MAAYKKRRVEPTTSSSANQSVNILHPFLTETTGASVSWCCLCTTSYRRLKNIYSDSFFFPRLLPFPDHCETPHDAYADVAPILEVIAKQLGKTKETVQIYEYVLPCSLTFITLHTKKTCAYRCELALTCVTNEFVYMLSDPATKKIVRDL